MDGNCDGGTQVTTSPLEFRCATCGVSCSPSCAFVLDSVTYCPRCAKSILDSEGVPLSLSAPVTWIRARADSPAPVESTSSRAKVQWVVLVARNQPDLLEHLERAFARDEKVEIVIDRRKDYSRNPPGLEERLRFHGAAVIRRRRRGEAEPRVLS